MEESVEPKERKVPKTYKKRKIVEEELPTVEVDTSSTLTSTSTSTISTRYPKLAKKDHMVIDVKMQYGAALVSLMLQELQFHSNAELEVRIGEVVVNENFHSGVPSEFYSHMLQLVASTANVAVEQPTYTMVCYYEGKVRAIQPLKSDCKTKDGKLQYEKGGRISKLDFVQVEQCGLHDLRFSIKEETELTSSELDTFFSTLPRIQSVRIKTRQSFRFPELGFKIDFTEAWLGKTEDQVNKLKAGIVESSDAKSHTYEIELEVLKAKINDQNNTNTTNVDARVIFQQAIQLLGQGAPGVLYLSPLI